MIDSTQQRTDTVAEWFVDQQKSLTDFYQGLSNGEKRQVMSRRVRSIGN